MQIFIAVLPSSLSIQRKKTFSPLLLSKLAEFSAIWQQCWIGVVCVWQAVLAAAAAAGPAGVHTGRRQQQPSHLQVLGKII